MSLAMSKTQDDMALDDLMCFSAYRLNLAFGRYYSAGFGETGFTYAKFVILMALGEGGAQSLGELSARIGVEPNSISPIVKKMANFGIIDRIRDPKDERRIVLELTPYGHTVLTEARRVVHQGWMNLGLDPDRVAEAVTVMEEARAKLDGGEMPKMPFPKRPDDLSD